MLSSNPSVQDISQSHLLEEPFVPIGGEPSPAENAALAAALSRYSKRSGPDDFSSLTGFLDKYPRSYWNAALLTNLGLEYFYTGHYSKALPAWAQAWESAKTAEDRNGKALADRAVGELAALHARLGHVAELETLFRSIAGRVIVGPATERICGAREGLANMQLRPETAFRCGPLALYRISLDLHPQNPRVDVINASASTRSGFTLTQLSELSRKLGLSFQMAYRENGAAFVVPSVVHFKLNHYAALIRQAGDRYLLQDPTFRNDIWITKEALEEESSGFFLIPPGELAYGWRGVAPSEGDAVHGKGNTNGPDPDPHGPCDPHTPGSNSCGEDDDCKGMAVSRVHLLVVSLNINDEPLGYTPPVGPPIRFIVRYNQREAREGPLFYSNLGSKWTFDWLSYITETSPPADVTYYIMGGGTRTFTGLNSSTGTFAPQQLDQTKLTRTSTGSYEMLSRDGSKKIFAQPDGSAGARRKIFLTKLIDPSGNSVALHYDDHLRLDTITDAIGQVTTISYEDATDIFKITKVTDPFGRLATFEYAAGKLVKINDVLQDPAFPTSGMWSMFDYDAGDFIKTLTTPYGVTRFAKSGTDEQFGPPQEPFGDTHRSLETIYPDGTFDRVEFNQNQDITGILDGAANSAPGGMRTNNSFLSYRNTFFWSRQASTFASSIPFPTSPRVFDYGKAKLYHWLHSADMVSSAGILESVKEPLEGRVWYDYAGQSNDIGGSQHVGTSNQPEHAGRVLDDGSTQLYSYEYNDIGNVIKVIDPIGRTFSFLYADNGIDLLETRQTRDGRDELLEKMTYDGQHHPLTRTDAAGQTTTFTYNVRGQKLTEMIEVNGKNETTTYGYDSRGFLMSIEGPLPGASTTFTYDAMGRVRTTTDPDGYTLTFEYDALDRLTMITYPDFTNTQLDYTHLDLTLVSDRAGRQTSFKYNSMREMIERTDPLGRVTRFQWCKCGALKKLVDPMGRGTTWHHDVQGRIKDKEYADGSKVVFRYEDTTSRLRQKIDEQLQVTQYTYGRDDTVSSIVYSNPVNPALPTPPVSFTYDQDYLRISSMTDGIGTTLYSYFPIEVVPRLGAGRLASTKGGPLFTELVEYAYDERGRPLSRTINGVAASIIYDAGGRVHQETNALGTFGYSYEGVSPRISLINYPNGQTATFTYHDNLGDRQLARVVYANGSGTPISEFDYDYNVPTGQISTWAHQSGGQRPVSFRFRYDDANQLTSASAATRRPTPSFSFTYDDSGNRLTERKRRFGRNLLRRFSYNALNQLTTADSAPESPATFDFDIAGRLIAVRSGDHETTFRYDGLGRRVGIREFTNNLTTEISNKSYVWCDSEICEERDFATPTKRFFPHGMKIETGAAPGNFFYTRDHLGSVRELVDDSGQVRARYDYSPFGSRSKIEGDLDAEFGFTGHLFHPATSISLAKYRAYDPALGRWLSRDPLANVETLRSANLYVYVDNDPINAADPLGEQASWETPELPWWMWWLYKKAVKCFCLCFDKCGERPTPYGKTTPEKCAEYCKGFLMWTCR